MGCAGLLVLVVAIRGGENYEPTINVTVQSPISMPSHKGTKNTKNHKEGQKNEVDYWNSREWGEANTQSLQIDFFVLLSVLCVFVRVFF